ncbi:MAG TPA: ATP-binding protein, partial [Acidimicrobiales bacterium]|nr:ATP-binding protein [Acidimicrobiales bacterium]
MSVASRSSEFPLVGRAEELALLRSVRAAAMSRSAVVSGPAGVGKSRLASAAASDAAADGWATVAIRGSAGLSGVPLGSLRTVLGITGPNELAELTAAVEGALLGLRSRKGLVVLADDCQQFDDATAGLLHQLVAGGSIVVIATARSGTQLPQAIVDLWKDGLAERLELQNLSRLETTQLLTRFLGGNVQDSSANRMWHVTA